MVSLVTQQSLQKVRSLPFCYLCGKDFSPEDATDRDHVPPESAFAKNDRQPVILKTHTACNHRYSADDEKIGQLIGLKHGKIPANPKNRRLRIVESTTQPGLGAVLDFNVEQAIWRWIAGFHAALYREPLVGARGSIVTPMPRADLINGKYSFVPLMPQHFLFVKTIKEQRMRSALDRISANNGKLTYECVWAQSDDSSAWLCIFALDIYEWKDLGRLPTQPTRGCAGVYRRQERPSGGTIVSSSPLILPNHDPLDPFAW